MQTTGKIPEMIDLVFDLAGESLPASYPFELWDELLRLSPLLAAQTQVGILPLRLTSSSDGMLLPKRTKLAIRLIEEVADRVAEQLSEQQIKVGSSRLRLGKGKKRPIQHYPTVHAPLVAGASDEAAFMADIETQLQQLGITGNLICGKRQSLSSAQRRIEGYSLVIHDLKADASLKLQYAGLGGFREFGCGIFIPYKVITGLDDD
jgi:CRISPR-associated protein Cas6